MVKGTEVNSSGLTRLFALSQCTRSQFAVLWCSIPDNFTCQGKVLDNGVKDYLFQYHTARKEWETVCELASAVSTTWCIGRSCLMV